jgi:Ig-like domain-containing protein
MKKLIATCFLVAFAFEARSQGLVNFLNTSATLISVLSPGSTTTIPPGVPGTFYFGLLTAPAGATDRSLFTFSGLYATNLASAGRIFGGNHVPVPNWPPGTTRSYLVCGWSSDLGHEWNPLWLQGIFPGATGSSFFGMSVIAMGAAGGVDEYGSPIPALNIFGATSISTGFVLGGWGPPPALTIVTQPQSQAAPFGSTVNFQVAVSSPCCQPTYQWFCNGIALSGEVGPVLRLENIQWSQNGNQYYVVVNGYLHSAVATLTVTPVPPAILVSPVTQTAETGSAIHLRFSASGSPPLAYQWLFNGAPIDGATNDALDLADIQPARTGVYVVVVTNTGGSATSAAALLSVIAPVPRRLVPALALQGQTGAPFNLEYSPAIDPNTWIILETVALTNSPQWYFDLSASPLQRLYRAWQADGSTLAPVLSLHMVPAITFTGGIGNTLRLDYINQFGPTDAWVTLTTVTLTNTTQLYFDTSIIGQPARLYRLVPLP